MNLLPVQKDIYSKFRLSGYVNNHWLEFAVNHVNPLWSPTRTKARLAAKRQETPDIVSLTLIPNRNWQGFVPGQFVPLRVNIGGIKYERCYSLTSTPDSPVIQVTVKKVQDGHVSSFIHDELTVGNIVELGNPAGDFVLPTQLPAKMLMLAGGVGITPLYSLITEALRRESSADIVLMYYARSERDFALLNRLEAAARIHPNLRLITRIGQPFSAEDLHAAIPDLAVRQAWACGPAPMLDLIESMYLDEQLSPQLHTERFARSRTQIVEGPAQTIRYRRSAVEATATASTLLEAAEQAGLRPAHGCRMGICNSCRCHKLEGTVRNTITGALNDSPNSDIQLCISQAVTAVTLDL